MLFFILAFLAGDLFFQNLAEFPDKKWLFLAIGFYLVLHYFLNKRWRYFYLLTGMLCGFIWSAWYAHELMSWSLPKAVEGKPIWVIGRIATLPVENRWQTSFILALEEWSDENNIHRQTALIRLGSRDKNQVLQVGARWRFLVRLKRMHGMQNPGTFDFEAWSLQKGWRASGYIVADKNNQLLAPPGSHFLIQQWRQYLQNKLKTQLPESTTAPWLMALILGERANIPHDDWEVLRHTGTNHLMAIAGLHIGIMSGLAHLMVSWLWRRSVRLSLRFPAQQAGACAALVIAVIYSMLAGFSIPTQRACLMLSAFIFTLLARRNIMAWHSWALALFLVLLLNPLSVLTESFWLSFGTIALIIYGMSARLAPQGFWWKWGRVQWVVGLGLMPLTLLLFQQCSLISFVANSIAIPWLSFFILPWCFLSSIVIFFSPTLGAWLLWLADKSLAGLWLILTWLSHLPFSTWQQIIPNQTVFVLSIIGFIYLLFPSGFPGRWFGVIALLPLWYFQPARPAAGEFWLTLLDVGQGLSVIVQTKNHTLIYDAGPRLSPQFDMGESVILPYLNSMMIKRIDRLVISHGDNDHIGGAERILQSMPVNIIRTSVPNKLLALKVPVMRLNYCFAQEAWQWDGVNFSFIYPTPDALYLGNNSCCVLRIENAKHHALLTGDIEKEAENRLLSRDATLLKTDILIAPHHGSKTSGIKKFVAATHPSFVLYATGYRNRYHFPHKSVVEAYEQIAATQLNTMETGAITFKLGHQAEIIAPELYRHIRQRYWF